MKQRVITGVILGALLLGMMLGVFTPVLTAVVILLSVVAVHEIGDCVGLKNLPMHILSCLSAIAIPLAVTFRESTSKFILPAAVFYVILQLCFMVLLYDKTPFTSAAVMIFTSVAVPEGFSMLIRLRDLCDNAVLNATKPHVVFLILFAFGASWVADIFALFCGKAFGKHKLCPTISPKKTVEGAIGGVLCAAIINCILLLVFRLLGYFGEGAESIIGEFYFVVPVSIVLSVISIFGDLSASVIKRNFAVKDFGKILPGHGGIMDRFDSTLFVFPSLYAIVYGITILLK